MALARVLYNEAQIQARVEDLALEISKEPNAGRPLLIGVLSGSVIFLSDLARRLEGDPDIDFMAVSSYGDERDPTGVVRITKDLDTSIDSRDVIVVEDVIDTGLTLSYLLRNLENRGPRSLRVCTLVNKPLRRIPQIDPDIVGFETEDYLVGYGLGFKGLYRNLPYLLAIQDLQELAKDPTALKDMVSKGDIQTGEVGEGG